VTVESVRLNFPSAGVWRYRIDVSQNGDGDWQTFVESGRTESPNQWTPHTVDGTPVSGRYLRITLLAWPEGAVPGISDLTASGVITAQ
jgi:hypothetical protein